MKKLITFDYRDLDVFNKGNIPNDYTAVSGGFSINDQRFEVENERDLLAIGGFTLKAVLGVLGLETGDPFVEEEVNNFIDKKIEYPYSELGAVVEVWGGSEHYTLGSLEIRLISIDLRSREIGYRYELAKKFGLLEMFDMDKLREFIRVNPELVVGLDIPELSDLEHLEKAVSLGFFND